MDYGKKVSQDGYNVKTCDDKNLVFSSKFNSLKIKDESATTLSVNNGATQTKTIAHGLGYAPSHYVFAKVLNYDSNDFWVCDGGGQYQLPIYDPSKATGDGSFLGDFSYFKVYTDATNLYIEIENQSGANKTYDIYYYILIEDNA